MIEKKLDEITKMVNGTLLLQTVENTVKGVGIDSRTITNKNLYIPIVGERFDGHDFINDVIKKGVTATFWKKNKPIPQGINVILVDDTLQALQQLAKQYLKQLSMRIIGITGSNGKTSIKDILAHILATKYQVKKTQGNRNNEIGLPLTILEFNYNDEIGILEMGMEDFNEIALLSEIANPDVAIISNIGTAHIVQLKTRENIAKAKLEILQGLKLDGSLIVNKNEPLLQQKYHNTLYFNINETQNLKQDETGITFDWRNEHFFAPVLGTHQVENILAALLCAEMFDVGLSQAKTALQSLKMTKMRNDFYAYKDVYILDDSYKSNPESVKAALQTLSAFSLPKVVVLADMLDLGEDEVAYHEEVGELLQSFQINKAYFYGPLSKHSVAKSKIETYYFEDKFQLATQLALEKNCVILFKASRGLKMEEVIEKFKEEKK